MQTWAFLLALLYGAQIGWSDTRVRYEGCQVYRVVPQSERQLQTLYQWINQARFSFWKDPSVLGHPVDIQVSPHELNDFHRATSALDLDPELMVEDVQVLIDTQMQMDHDDTRYYNLSELYNYLNDMTAECGSTCEVVTIGQSYEGRDLQLIKIGREGESRPGIWIDCGIHAREWISPAVCQYMIARLIEEEDEDVPALRDAYDWYIHPSVNVDGYEYTWTTDRMWRKTRKPNEGSQCVGTDGNRNFEIGWGGTGSSDEPCSQTYRGTEFFSEVETKALDDFLTPIGSQFDLALTIHSYGQFFVYPWGYTTDEDPENAADLAQVAQVGEDTMNAVHDTGYTGRRSNGDMAGNTIDWAKQKAGVTYSYLFEVRDDGEFGFLLPEDQIQPTGEEIWAGVKAMVFEIIAIEGTEV